MSERRRHPPGIPSLWVALALAIAADDESSHDAGRELARRILMASE